jgi:hypothetical protein
MYLQDFKVNIWREKNMVHYFLGTPCNFVMSVRPRGTTGLHWTDFGDFLYCRGGSGRVYRNISKKLKFGQNRTIIKAALHADVHTRVTG